MKTETKGKLIFLGAFLGAVLSLYLIIALLPYALNSPNFKEIAKSSGELAKEFKEEMK